MRDRIGRLFILIVPAFLIVAYTVIASRLVDIDFLSILPAIMFLFIAFFIHYKDYKGSRKYQLIYIILFVLDLILIIYNSIYKNLPMTGVDWHNFDNYAQSALASSSNIFEIFSNSIDLFSAFIAILYRVFGVNISIVFFYILPLAFVASRYLYKTVYVISGNKKTAMLASIILLIMPANFIFSLSVLREIPIQCAVSISLYSFVKYLREEKVSSVVMAFFFATIAVLMHSGMIAVPIIYLYVFLQKKFFKNIKILRLATVFFALLLILGISLPVFSPIMKRFGADNGVSGVVNMVTTQNGYLLDATTVYISEAPKDIFELITSLPYRIIMFVVSPLPWQIHGVDTLLAFFADAIFRYYIVFKIIRVMFNLRKYSIEDRGIAETLLMSIVVFDLIFCLGTTNYGTAMRHRTKMLPFELALLSIPVVAKRREHNNRLEESDR